MPRIPKHMEEQAKAHRDKLRRQGVPSELIKEELLDMYGTDTQRPTIQLTEDTLEEYFLLSNKAYFIYEPEERYNVASTEYQAELFNEVHQAYPDKELLNRYQDTQDRIYRIACDEFYGESIDEEEQEILYHLVENMEKDIVQKILKKW